MRKNFTTFEEFEKNYYPAEYERRNLKEIMETNPSEFGKYLADKSIEYLGEILNKYIKNNAFKIKK